MEDKIVRISGFGVENTASTQCNFMVVGLTESGRVVITQGDGRWTDISHNAPEPASTPDGAGAGGCRKCGGDHMTLDCDESEHHY